MRKIKKQQIKEDLYELVGKYYSLRIARIVQESSDNLESNISTLADEVHKYNRMIDSL